MSWDITRQLLLPAAVGNVQGTLHVSTTRTTQPLSDAQNHVPAAYVIVRDFLSTDEVHKLHAWFVDPVSPATATTFDGEPLDAAAKTMEPTVLQLYGQPEPLERRFPSIFQRLLALKDVVGRALGLDEKELDEVTYAQDVRHITYHAKHGCPWHVDDPVSHFNTVMLLSKPGADFGGGNFMVHAGPCLCGDEGRPLDLCLGDAVIYSAAKVDHAVSVVTCGERRICLVELRRRSLARCGQRLPRGATDVPGL